MIDATTQEKTNLESEIAPNFDIHNSSPRLLSLQPRPDNSGPTLHKKYNTRSDLGPIESVLEEESFEGPITSTRVDHP